MEVWGGIECTLNRIGHQFFSQSERNGHLLRRQDIELFSELRLHKIRYPCLWEMVCPDEYTFRWGWLDDKLALLQKHGLSPIAGLLHHGSGPSFTNLLDPAFPTKFTKYAEKFSRRYPWVTDFIPIDEILTTARFSCLYGHWYPHHKSDASFARALFHQVKASIMAMNAIRQNTPQARFIQAEDLGRAQSTEPLNYQRDFENDRRWLAIDLLCGRVNETHPLYHFLRSAGLEDQELTWLQNNSLSPDIFGINHYLLSNRYLDHELAKYPPHYHGRNHYQDYADVSSADTNEAQFVSPGEVFREAWDRYQIPLAVTEVHLRGYREDQLRWFHQIWQEANQLRRQNVDIQAVTAWALLGSYDWHNLCTRPEGFYESGVYDLRTPQGLPRKTALTSMVKTLASGQNFDHPLVLQDGWWKSRTNLLFSQPKEKPATQTLSRPIIITGGKGTLGQAFARICERRDIPFVLLGRDRLDIADEAAVRHVLEELRPWGVINAAGYVHVDLAESNSERCFRENVHGAVNLARYCADQKISFVTFSTDLVFDGENDSVYLESHPVAPLNVYGESKVRSEQEVLSIYPEALVIRTSAFFGPWDRHNFAIKTLEKLQRSEEVHAASDTRLSATYVPDLVNTSLELMIDQEQGLFHLTNHGGRSWSELIRTFTIAASRHIAGLDSSLIIDKPQHTLSLRARRPLNSVLGSERATLLPSVDEAMERYFYDLKLEP